MPSATRNSNNYPEPIGCALVVIVASSVTLLALSQCRPARRAPEGATTAAERRAEIYNRHVREVVNSPGTASWTLERKQAEALRRATAEWRRLGLQE